MRKEGSAGLALSAPAAILLLLLLFVPSSAVLALSFTDYEFGMGGLHFVGLANYGSLLSDPRFRQSLSTTLIYLAVVAPVSVILALGLAVSLEGAGRFKVVYRSVFFLPVTSTLVALATAWEVLLHPTFGFVNVVLSILGFTKIRFLSDPHVALYTLAAIGVWKQLSFNVLLFVAGLSTIRRDLYEAAAIDGADRGWSRFWMVDMADARPGHNVRLCHHAHPRPVGVRHSGGAHRRRPDRLDPCHAVHALRRGVPVLQDRAGNLRSPWHSSSALRRCR